MGENMQRLWAFLQSIRGQFTKSLAKSSSIVLFTLLLFFTAFVSIFFLNTTNILISTITLHKYCQNNPKMPLNCTSYGATTTCPSYHTTAYNHEIDHNRLSSPTCPQHFRWIYEDLRPWAYPGISRDMVERAQSMAHFRLVIVKGKAYVETYRKPFQNRDVFTLWGILHLLRRYPRRIPDLDLMINCGDRPVVQSRLYGGPNATSPPPLFRYCRDENTLDIVFPDWSFWGWPEINIKPWVTLLKDLKKGNKRKKWVHREPHAYWKGNYVAATRQDLLKCNVSDKQDWNARLYVQAQEIGNRGSKFIQEELKMEYVYDYMLHIFNEYAKLLQYQHTIPQKATELCSEAMACRANGLTKEFMMESIVKAPAVSGPCNMPPPYDPSSLYSLLERMTNSIKEVSYGRTSTGRIIAKDDKFINL